jgi:hypothetical protein
MSDGTEGTPVAAVVLAYSAVLTHMLPHASCNPLGLHCIRVYPVIPLQS